MGHHERNRDAGEPRPQVGVAEQREAVGGDQDQRGQRRRLVGLLEPGHRAGPFAERIAIARPMPTETATRTRATTPKARLAIQKMCWPGSV